MIIGVQFENAGFNIVEAFKGEKSYKNLVKLNTGYFGNPIHISSILSIYVCYFNDYGLQLIKNSDSGSHTMRILN